MKIPNAFAKKPEGQRVTLADAAAAVHREAAVVKEKHSLATELKKPQEITVEGKNFVIEDDGSSREIRPV